MTCVFATNNPSKITELRTVAEPTGIKLLTFSDVGFICEPDETGTTFEENALIKARQARNEHREHISAHSLNVRNAAINSSVFAGDIREATHSLSVRNAAGSESASGFIFIADDSGLCIDALNGEPGVDSANFMGRDTPYNIRNSKILQMLAAEENRAARFVCVIAAILPDGRELLTRATVEGQISRASAGENGFGYDPIFFVPNFGKTMAELSPGEKNAISHRGKAFREMLKLLSEARI
ncbi:MAG: non-canonical purine NTP pyrophosphatase [Defluviitaleaceae bacterium]|nr:non-canonical purine NTP pyrophosphatase [Defluviitaleaceae bacterium]